MENYREKLKLQNVILAVGAAVLAVFCLLAALGEAGFFPAFTPAAGDSHWHSMWRGFLCGASFGVLALLVFGLIRNLLALGQEARLKKLYIKQNDERAIQVYLCARSAGCQTFLLLGLVATIITGYFHVAVGLTVLACVVSLSLFTLGFKVYYNKKL